MNTVCKNCGQSLTSEYIFCPFCGQKAVTHRLDLHEIIHDFIHAFTHFDKGILFLVKHLTYHPGIVAREYVDGKRKKYFNPLNFLVIMVALAFFLVLKYDKLVIHYLPNPDTKSLLHFAFKYFTIFMLVMCQVNALLIWAAFKKYKMKYAEYQVLSAYMIGQIMFFDCFVILFIFFFGSYQKIASVLFALILTFWFIGGVVQFHKKASLKNILIALLVFVIFQIISQGLMYSIFLLFGKSIQE